MTLDGGSPNLADVIEAAIEARLRQLHTALPGKVTEYDATSQTATVKPMVKQAVQAADGSWIHEEYAEIFDVPVMFFRSAAMTLTFPIPVGTTGLLVFCERDIGQWRATGQNGSPGDQRAHSMAGAVFLPTMAPDASVSGASGDHAVVRLNGSTKLRLGSASANESAVNGDTFKTEFDAHAHATPFGPTGAPIVPLSAASLSTKIKVE
jgi:hypothetical protein